MDAKKVRTAVLDDAFAKECFPELFLTDEIRNQIEDLGRLKQNEAADGTGVPYNVLLVCDEPDRRIKFLEGLSKYLERVVPGVHGISLIQEEQLRSAERNLEQVQNRGMVLAVVCTDSEAADSTERIEQILESYPSMTKIICVTKRQEKNRFQGNEKLYWRLLRTHFYIRDLTIEEVEEAIEQRLLAYLLTDEFRKGLKKYNQTVYPKASLQNDEYVDDLYDRIISKYQKRERNAGEGQEKVLDEFCVPYYHEPENISQIFSEFEQLHGYQGVKEQIASVCKRIRMEKLSVPSKDTYIYLAGEEGSGRKWIAEHILSRILFSMGIIDLDGMLTVREGELDAFLQNDNSRLRRLICIPDSSRILTVEEQEKQSRSAKIHHSYVLIQNTDLWGGGKEQSCHLIRFTSATETDWAENFREYCNEKMHRWEKGKEEEISNWIRSIFIRQMTEGTFRNWNSVKALYQKMFDRCVEEMSLTEEYTQLPVIRASYLEELCVPKEDYHLPVIEKKAADAEHINLSDEKAVILLLPSDYNSRSQPQEYVEYQDKKQKEENIRKYQGIQTNDAPVQYLIDQVYADKKKLEKVICLTTSRVNSPKKQDLAGKSVLDRLQMLIEEYLNKNYDQKSFASIEKIAVDYEEGMDSTEKSEIDISRERIPQIFRELQKKLEGCKYVYIDYTGGLRDTSFLMVVIIRFLESMGIECRKVVYSNFHCKPKALVDMTESHYKILQMINVTDEFLKSGNARGMEEFFKNMPDEKGCEKVRNVITALNEFSDTVNLCNLESLDEKIKMLVSSIEEFEAEKENPNLYCEMFRALLPTIKKNMYMDVKENRLIDANCHVNYPQVIRWCLNYNLIQQALTLYVEKMPVYYIEHQYIPKCLQEEVNGKKETKERADAEVLYTNVFDNLRKEDSRVKAFQRYLKEEVVKKLEEQNNNDIEELKSIIRESVTEKYGDVAAKMTLDRIIVMIRKEEKKGKSLTAGTLTDLVRRFSWSNAWEVVYGLETKDTYRKKLKVIDRVQKNEYKQIKSGKNTLYQILAYYLKMKILRNQINHAKGEEDEQKGINDVMQILGDELNISKQTVKGLSELINHALDCLNDAEKIVWQEGGVWRTTQKFAKKRK